ncbi:MAG: hypothetical protein HZA93_06515 [Verrucomicrobia bacterium]|nr:hypothetical protein [Verrucomicrobiota bacterium]
MRQRLQIYRLTPRWRAAASWWRAAGALGACLFASVAGAGETAKPRGMWFWSKPASPDGAVNIVGRPEREDEALATFQRWHIRRLYGSYATLPVEAPERFAAWQRRLHAAGIRSFALFAGTSAVTPGGRADFLREVEERVLRFNASRTAADERFDGIALDLEPHIRPDWKTGTAATRRALLDELLATFVALRAHLDANGGRSLVVTAALPTWFDKVGPEARIGWADAADRDAWFARVAAAVSSISLMAYETDRPASIASACAWEREHFKGTVVTALRARLGAEWKTLADLTRVLPEIEAPLALGIDLENYELLRLAERAAAK